MSGIKDLAAKGRNGDNTLMHVSTDEVAGLNALARDMMGQELTTNPETGLPEAFLFAPLAAPMVAGGLGLGGGAIATGLTAGALGAAEAELRDMDDPLKRGLFAGLSAGAASGIGNQLSAAGGTEQAVQSGPSAGNLQSVPQQSFPGTQFTPPPTPAQSTASLGLSPAAPTQLTQPTTSGGGSFLGQYGDVGQMAEGAKNIFADEGTRQQFMQNVRAPATAGFIGLGGQAQMRAQDEMKDRQEAADAEKAAELKEAQDRIRANYASVGRPMPTGFGGGPLFAGGGIVNLRRGGSLGDGGGRAANQGGMGGSRRGSSGGGRGQASSHPGRPGGEAGTRSLSLSGPRSSSSPAVQNTPQLDPQAIENAVIGPGDRLAQGINSLTQLSPLVRTLRYLGRDRRALGGSSGHAPGAPRAGQPSIDNSGPRGNATSQMPVAEPSTTKPTIPLTANTAPTPSQDEFDKFLDALQQGRGNRAAMQQTGYGMASGGYLDGGMLPGDGMSDDVPATIDGNQPAALSSGEFVIPADVVSHIGNGSSDSGAKELYAMMDRIREARTGEDDQAPEINARKMMPK